MFAINAEIRKGQNKGANRRLRVVSKFPAVIYSGKEAPLAVELDHDKVMNIQAKVEFYDEILATVVDGKGIKIKARDMQRHPHKPKLQHIDFAYIQLLNRL